MADRKWYVTVKGGGSYSSASGGRLTGGPNEVSEEVAREIAAAGLDWITVGHKPVSLAETALRGPLTLEDIFPAVQEAQAASANAEQPRLEPATPVDEREPLASSEAEVEAKLAKAGSGPLPVAETAEAPAYEPGGDVELPASEDEVAANLAEGEEAEGSEEGEEDGEGEPEGEPGEPEGEPLPSNDAPAEEPAEAPEPDAAPELPEHTCPYEDCDGHGHAYASQASLDRHLKSKHGEES